MEHRADDPKNGGSASSTVHRNTAEPPKFELPVDLDDILAVAILDSILRVKRPRPRNRGAARRPR
jgi:hypothetical protein